MSEETQLEDWLTTAKKLTVEELLDLLTGDKEPEGWRVMAALGFLALHRGEIGLHQIQVLTSAGMDVLSLNMFDSAFAEADATDQLVDLLDE